MKRRVAREKALQALYQIDVSGAKPAEALEYVLDEEKTDLFLQKLIEGTIENVADIDKEISKHLEHWSIDRLAKVDLNILRIGVYEIMFSEGVPQNVAINEAVEIAKRFGDEKSSKFINGILSKVKGEG
ncbi:transcription antitermination factor NusB [Lederbergia citrea]|uniref:Transcription antitermination protein NusB n=1 Tax=Lederbergia citrea TaxID=2833581 RepID=A0A942UJ10_9BACI|nr:transcription antitermination factor NusB [Lederbergia citrea]MBS4176386.1 transcription antitermination factor NusB [Lederbergia citrea]MBS4202947.1 transcription antitermination factor NusB [Lederbergia citrea]MBS4222381.1 transcription antitermination factor NusB [Lederbergia citrea]